MITITDSAKHQFQSLMEQNGFEAFMFAVNGGGCSGFNYMLEGVSLEDSKKGDDLVEFDDVKIIVDDASVFALIGTEINYNKTIMGSSFEFSNPMAASSCGCGTSFSVKE